MNSIPYLYISNSHCQGPNWSAELEASAGLPTIPHIMEALDPSIFEFEKLAILFADDLLHPLRIELEEKAAGKELNQYLLWKLKRFLPWPVDQVTMRHLPLEDPKTFMTFSLPKTWLTDLFDAMSAQGVHCGYMGGLFLTLLENKPAFRNQLTVALFNDFYMLSRLNGKGDFLDFRTRRLPFKTSGQLDAATLVQGDLAPMRDENGKILLLNFSSNLDQERGDLLQLLEGSGMQPHMPELPGAGVLARFESCMNSKAGLP